MIKLLAFAAVALLGTSSLQAAENVFRWAPQAPVATLDPHASGDTTTRNIMINVYEGLVRHTAKSQLDPELAVSWEAVAPTTWRIKLRPNVTFHDGSPFTADDVIFSFNRATASSSDIRAKLRAIKEITKVDNLTIDAHTNGPSPLVMKGVLYFMPILNKSWAEKNDAVDPADNRRTGKENFATRNANGTGPFKIVSYSGDGKMELAPNEKWWDKKEHNLSKVAITPIQSNATRVAALLSGEAELITPVPIQDIKRIKDSPDYDVLTGPESRAVYLGYDQWRDELLHSSVKGKNPFKDIRVREAFAHAIDMKAISDRVLRGAGRPLFAMIPDTADGWIEDFWARPEPNVATAKKLMEEAGYGDGFSVTMDCPSNGLNNMGEPVCVAITGMLARIGVKVDVLLQPGAAYAGKLGRQDTSFYIHSWGAATGDAHPTMDLTVFTKGKETGTWNVGGYSNPEVDGLITAVATEMDLKKRSGMMTKALSIHREEFGTIPLYQPMLSYGVSKKVNVVQRGDDAVQLRWVTFK